MKQAGIDGEIEMTALMIAVLYRELDALEGSST